MKKTLLLLMFINIVNAQLTRKELLEMAITLDWQIQKSSSTSISVLTDSKAHELNISPLHYWEFNFNGQYQNSKLIKAKKISSTKVKYIAQVNFKDAPRITESKIINSYKGEEYCGCNYLFKGARVKVTKKPTWVEDKTAYYYKEYEVY